MYDHVGLRVKNLGASVRFYEAALAPLGHVLASRDEAGAGLGPKAAPAFWLTAGNPQKNTGTHVAFRAKDHESVDRFYAAGLKAGGKDNGRPGPRPDYGETYYAAFLLDPDGNNVEAVCLAKQ
ncbi:MAG: VOC family protein [Methylobacteriaceae bacterium]|nr:VOC family protein [Methylobacteriaceae bacterium]MBV9395787.1 VOC family protein [Methylobacteriaceae bacterium]